MSFSKTYQDEATVLARLNAIGLAKIKVGTYTGDAAASLAVTGVGFRPTFLIVYEMVTNKNSAYKSSLDGTKTFVNPNGGAQLYVDDQIISLDADGFTVGDGTASSNCLNEASAYIYIAFRGA